MRKPKRNPNKFEVAFGDELPEYALGYYEHCISELDANQACALYTNKNRLYVVFDQDEDTQNRLAILLQTHTGGVQLTPAEALRVVKG